MAELPRKFSLRFFPLPEDCKNMDPKLGGTYATAKQGVGKPIEVAPQSHEYMGYQKWRLSETSNGLEECQILFVRRGSHGELRIGGPGFTNTSDSAGTPVMLSDTASTYRMECCGKTKDGNPVFTIHPNHTSRPGVEYYVGKSDDDDTLEIQVFPVDGSLEGRPGWIV
ncbi:hypothetical protein FRC09_005603, partial [Ceratobasidium sp. 395]